MNGLVSAAAVLTDAIASRVFPAASVEVGSSGGVMWQASFGRLAFDEDAAGASPQTVFDLASLTKVIATTTFVMEQLEAGRLRLDERVAASFPEWRGVDREEATVRDLLEHASGLPARLVDAPPDGRRAFEHEICSLGLEYRRRSRAIYSDLGFILLGFLVGDRAQTSLDAHMRLVRGRLAAVEPVIAREPLTFDLATPDRPPTSVAPTLPMPDDRRHGRMLGGEVHDNYASALGGAAGHAGLFGNAPAVGAFARVVLRAARGDRTVPAPLSPELVAIATTKSTVPSSSRALGWDTMLPTSSCGTRMSPRAFGHVGFTGTSLWLDPVRDRYFVLLTNRACGGGTIEQMRDVRRAFHDALGDL